MNSSKRFLKSSVIFFIGNVSSKFVSFLMIPLYSTMISPDSFGKYDIGVVYASFAFNTLFCAVWMGTMRYMCDDNSKVWKSKVVFNGNIAFLIFSGIYLLLFIVANVFLEIEYFPLVVLYGLICALQMQVCYIARGYGHNRLFASSGIINSIVNASLNIFFIGLLRSDYQWLYIAAIIGMIVQVIYIFVGLKFDFHFNASSFSPDLIKKIVQYCLPLCLNFSAMWFLLSYNRIVLVQVMGAEQNGFFAMASKFNTIVTLVGSCFGFAWQELSFNKGFKEKQDIEFYQTASMLYLKVVFWAQLIIIPAVSIVFDLVINSNYANSKIYVPLALISSLFGLFSGFLGDIFLAIKQTKVVFTSMLFSAIVNVILMHLLVNILGVHSANISMIVGFTINICIRSCLLKREISLELSKPLLKFFFFSFIFLFIQIVVYNLGNVLINGLSLIVVGMAALWAFKTEIKIIFNQMKSPDYG